MRAHRFVLAAAAFAGSLSGSAAAQLVEGPPGTVEASTIYRPKTQREVELFLRYSDYHQGIVGAEIITNGDVLGFIQNPSFEDPVVGRPSLTREEAESMRIEAALTALMELRLKVLGGRAQGYDPGLVEAQVDSTFDWQVGRLGGPTRATEKFAEWGFSPDSFKDYLRDRLISNLWEDATTGRAPGATGRVYVDRFVRPGQIYALYKQLSESPDPRDRARVGKTDGRLTLRSFVVLIGPGQKPADRRTVAETARQRVLDGIATLPEMIAEYAPVNVRGEDSLMRDELLEMADESLRLSFPGEAAEVSEFVRNAEVGEISPVFTNVLDGREAAYVVLEIVDRTAPTELTPFADRDLQEQLVEEIHENLDKARVEIGLGRLVQSTFVAPKALERAFIERGRRQPRR